jgi:hypothetical protein
MKFVTVSVVVVVDVSAVVVVVVVVDIQVLVTSHLDSGKLDRKGRSAKASSIVEQIISDF